MEVQPEQQGTFDDGVGEQFVKTKANEKKDKKSRKAEERRRQREAKKAAAAADKAKYGSNK